MRAVLSALFVVFFVTSVFSVAISRHPLQVAFGYFFYFSAGTLVSYLLTRLG